MPEFPRTENAIIDQARQLIGGLNATEDDLPAIPVSEDELKSLLEEHLESVRDETMLAAQLKTARQRRRSVIKQIAEATKDDLDYLSLKYRKQPVKLMAYGWGARRSSRKTVVPDQPRHLEILSYEENNLYLDWKSPVGGKVVAYIVKRRLEGETEFQTIQSTVKTAIKLTNQPRRLRMSFYVVSINKAGESAPSNTVEITL